MGSTYIESVTSACASVANARPNRGIRNNILRVDDILAMVKISGSTIWKALEEARSEVGKMLWRLVYKQIHAIRKVSRHGEGKRT